MQLTSRLGSSGLPQPRHGHASGTPAGAGVSVQLPARWRSAVARRGRSITTSALPQ